MHHHTRTLEQFLERRFVAHVADHDLEILSLHFLRLGFGADQRFDMMTTRQ